MSSRYNNLRLGIILGFLAPLLGFVIIYLVAFRDMPLSDYLETIAMRKKLSSLISLSVIPNLLLFFIFIWLNYLYSARGVLASTFLFALIVVITRFII
jgi:hypothetical protein